MKRLSLAIILVLMSILLSSCIASEANVQDRIGAPNNKLAPITGKWVLEESIIGAADDNGEDFNDPHIGTEGLFHKEAVVIGDDFTTNPSFKIKTVVANDYLLYKYKTDPKSLGIRDANVQIITIMKDNQHFYEFIKYDEDKFITHINNTFYKLKQIAEEISLEEINRYIDVERTIARTVETLEVDKLQTGILLGLRIPTYDEVNELPDWDYKTIWINSQDKEIVGIYELDELLVPRKNGFWTIDVLREDINGSVIDRISGDEDEDKSSIMMEDGIDLDTIVQFKSNVETGSVLKNIQFVGNDYISIEKIESDNHNRQTLEVYAIDNIGENKPIKLSDLIGEDGKEIFQEGAQNILSLGTKSTTNETNVGLSRRNGYWIIKGRINYKQNNEELYKDFNVKAIPPKEMVSYDELISPWNIIKTQFPMVQDVFSSPNKEFALVVTRSHLMAYGIESGEIDINKPKAKIKLPYNASIIMSEWAVGRYSEIWENEVIEKGGSIIEN